MNKNNKIIFGTLGVIALTLGATDYLVYNNPVIRNYLSIALLLIAFILIFYWYLLDSKHQGYQRSVLLNIGVVAVTWVALPYYLFRSRKDAARFYAIGAFILLIISWYVLYYVGFYILWVIQNL